LQEFEVWLMDSFNATYEDLFSTSGTDYVYTYHQRSGHFSGPVNDRLTINLAPNEGWQFEHCQS
jgi:hypothetical protein